MIRKRNRLTIRIQKPVSDVFLFLLNPNNTPLWTPDIVEEMTNAWPPQEGTVYKNRTRDGAWHEYILTAIDENKLFILKAADGNYHVRYTFAAPNPTTTDLEYYEWVIRGNLTNPYKIDGIQKLKEVIEGS